MLDEALVNFAHAFQAKVEEHFKNSNEPLYAPRVMFEEYRPHLRGNYVTALEDHLNAVTDLPGMYRIIGWMPDL